MSIHAKKFKKAVKKDSTASDLSALGGGSAFDFVLPSPMSALPSPLGLQLESTSHQKSNYHEKIAFDDR